MPTTNAPGACRSTLSDYLPESLVVGEPDVAGSLAVFPIFGPACRQGFVSFSQAARDVGARNEGPVQLTAFPDGNGSAGGSTA